MALTRDEVRRFYDRFGSRQDAQGFYEDRALQALITNARLKRASTVFEFGCGTGKLAETLLSSELPPQAEYVGCDLSPVMVRLATERLRRFGARARAVRTEGEMAFPIRDHSADCVIATYVLDLLSEGDTARFLQEARRALKRHGELCLAGLTWGTTIVSRVVASSWYLVYRVNAKLVGGCRPVRCAPVLAENDWEIQHREVVVSWGIASEVIVAKP